MTKSKIILGSLALLAIAGPASADIGPHNHGLIHNIIHWLSSPTHSLFAVLGGVAISAIIFKFARKRT